MTHTNSDSGAFRSEQRQALHNIWLYVSMVAVLCILFVDSYDPLIRTITGEYPRMYNSTERYSITMLFGMIPLLAAILSGLPYAASYAQDVTSGLLGVRMTRCGRTEKYISGKYGATFMSGALTLGVPVAIFILITVCVCGEYRWSEESASVIEQGIFAPLLNWGGVPFFIVQVAMLAMFGGLWACVGLTVSAWIVNKYVAVIAPFVIYFALVYLTQNLNIRMLDPGQLLYLMPNFQLEPPLGICILTLVPLAETALTYWLFRQGVLRRWKNGRI